MVEESSRTVLQRLMEERGVGFSGLSRLIGRNPAYLQQFVRRGTPRRLAEADRRVLADFFQVDEMLLGGPAPLPAAPVISVARIAVRASAGPGAAVLAEDQLRPIAFDRAWLRELRVRDPAQLSMIRVEGDSMIPTLADGDEILVDRSDTHERLRDGIYVIRSDDMLVVKRVAVAPGGRVSVGSDNAAYPPWPDRDAAALELIGRVVWTSRKLA
jgi:phage repressor protein C with HTH and peptisase S24 domain